VTELVSGFAHSGFAGATVDEIARNAGYTTGALYWRFAGKDNRLTRPFEAFTTTRVRELRRRLRCVRASETARGDGAVRRR
jgi:AcrR family transcriptional regulator